jgi:hypothetical protein
VLGSALAGWARVEVEQDKLLMHTRNADALSQAKVRKNEGLIFMGRISLSCIPHGLLELTHSPATRLRFKAIS